MHKTRNSLFTLAFVSSVALLGCGSGDNSANRVGKNTDGGASGGGSGPGVAESGGRGGGDDDGSSDNGGTDSGSSESGGTGGTGMGGGLDSGGAGGIPAIGGSAGAAGDTMSGNAGVGGIPADGSGGTATGAAGGTPTGGQTSGDTGGAPTAGGSAGAAGEDVAGNAGVGGIPADGSGGTATGAAGGTPTGGQTSSDTGGAPTAGGSAGAAGEDVAGNAGVDSGGTSGGGMGGAGGCSSAIQLPNPIHVAVGAGLESADGTEGHPFPSLANAVTAIRGTEGCDSPWDGRIIVHDGRYEVRETIELPPSADVEFEAGVTMAMGVDVSLHANRNVKVLGSEQNQVLFTWLVEDDPWGSFTLFVPDSRDNEFYWATFEHGSTVTYKDISVRGTLSLEGASGHISHCTFQNVAGDDGLSLGNAGALVDYCRFLNNSGDGLDADGASGAEIAFCYFDGNGNDALDLGEGADLWAHDNVMLNSADTGVEIGEGSTPRIDHNVMAGNHIGIGIRDDSDPVVSNNTVYGNEYGIAGYHFKADYGYGKGSVVNTIVSGSLISDIALTGDSSTVFSYSCIQSGTYVVSIDEDPPADFLPLEGDGLISAGTGCDDPLFVDAAGLDFHLMSTAGHWNAAGQSWLNDDVSSPCIDTGDPQTGVGVETAPNGGLVNMGAFGGRAEASHSPPAPPG